MRKYFIWGLLGLVILVGLATVQYPDDKLHVIFCDVGQGDASLVIRGSFQMVIDGGPSGAGILDCLAKNVTFWDR